MTLLNAVDIIDRLYAQTTHGTWTNEDPKRGANKSLWVQETAREVLECEWGPQFPAVPSRYGPQRTYVANFRAPNQPYLPAGSVKEHKRLTEAEAQANAAFVAAVKTAWPLISQYIHLGHNPGGNG